MVLPIEEQDALVKDLERGGVIVSGDIPERHEALATHSQEADHPLLKDVAACLVRVDLGLEGPRGKSRSRRSVR